MTTFKRTALILPALWAIAAKAHPAAAAAAATEAQAGVLESDLDAG